MFKIDESRIALAKALEDLSHNEWAVADWRDNAVVNVDCEDAFKSILPVLELALEQTDEYAFDSCCILALQFAGIAQTTEHPTGLIDMLKLLSAYEQRLTQSNRKVKELARWFRVLNAI